VQVLSVSPGLTLHEVALALARDLGTTFAKSFVSDAASLAASSPFRPTDRSRAHRAGSYLLTSRYTPMSLARNGLALRQEGGRPGSPPRPRSTDLTPTADHPASIVEKEGLLPSNMPQVARVIFNRLERGGPLQMDATVLYYLDMDGGTVTPAMLQTPSPTTPTSTSG